MNPMTPFAKSQLRFGFTETDKTGATLRNEGMDRALDNAGDWTTCAQEAMDAWFATVAPLTIFKGEDIREAIEGGLAAPKTHHVWGGVMGGRLRRWKDAGLIEFIGYEPAESLKTHAHPVKQYRRTTKKEDT